MMRKGQKQAKANSGFLKYTVSKPGTQVLLHKLYQDSDEVYLKLPKA